MGYGAPMYGGAPYMVGAPLYHQPPPGGQSPYVMPPYSGLAMNEKMD